MAVGVGGASSMSMNRPLNSPVGQAPGLQSLSQGNHVGDGAGPRPVPRHIVEPTMSSRRLCAPAHGPCGTVTAISDTSSLGCHSCGLAS